MANIDLEELYKQSKVQGIVEDMEPSGESDIDLESLYEESKKGLVSNPKPNQVSKDSQVKLGMVEKAISPMMEKAFPGWGQARQEFENEAPGMVGRRRFVGQLGQSVLTSNATGAIPVVSKMALPSKLAVEGAVGAQSFDYKNNIDRLLGTGIAAVGGGVLGQAITQGPKVVKALGDKLGFGLMSKIGQSQEELSSIAQNAARETGASEAQVAYNIKTLKEAKASELGRFDSITKEAENLNAQSIALKEGKKSILGQKLPDVAYQSGQNIRQRFISTIRRNSEEYSKQLDNLIGGKNQDIYISNDKVLSSIEDALLDRNVAMSFNDKGKLVIEGAASSAENKLVNLYNKLSKGGDVSTIGIREVIKDKQMLGRGVKYGKAYGYEDDLINDVVQRLGKRVEADIPGLKELNSRTSKFLKIKDEANERLGLFKQGSPKPREFVEAFAKGQLKPEERVFLESLRKELPQFDKLARSPKALAQGMDEYDMAIAGLKKNPKEAIPQITARFDEEIAKLQSALDIDKARIGNEALAKSKPIIESITKMESKLRKLKITKDALVTAGSIGGAYYGLRAILNYGYNTLFTD